MGPPRFELKSIPPQGTRMPSYPTGPNIWDALVFEYKKLIITIL